MFYTIYSIKDKLTEKIYIGKHKTKNLNDDYMGSGNIIISKIKKYGKENFEKTTLFVFSSKEEMDAKEAELVNENFINSKISYNLALGGRGGWDVKKAKIAFLGRKHTKESREKISKFQKENNASKRPEVKEKISKAQKGIPRPYVSEALTGKKKSEEHKRKISEAIKRKHLERMGSGAIGSADDSES
jgi:hypothetical protein